MPVETYCSIVEVNSLINYSLALNSKFELMSWGLNRKNALGLIKIEKKKE